MKNTKTIEKVQSPATLAHKEWEIQTVEGGGYHMGGFPATALTTDCASAVPAGMQTLQTECRCLLAGLSTLSLQINEKSTLKKINIKQH